MSVQRLRVLCVVAVAMGALLGGCTKSHDVNAVGQGLDDGTNGEGDGSGTGSGDTVDAGSGIGTGSAGSGSGNGNGNNNNGTGSAGSGGGNTTNGCVDCQGASVGGFLTLGSCCASTRDGDVCGLDVSSLGLGGGCLERDAPGAPDSSCPAASLMGITLEGCCRADGSCGVLDMFVGLGCTMNPDGVNKGCVYPGPD